MTSLEARTEARTFDAERVLLTVLLVLRGVVLLVAVVAEASGWSQFDGPGGPWLSLATLLAVVAESVWLARRTLARRTVLDGRVLAVDAVAGFVALIGCGLAIGSASRLTAVNWGNVFAIVAVTPMIGAARRRLMPGAVIVGGFVAVTTVLGWHAGMFVDRASTAMYFAGLFVGARYIQAQVRRWADVEEVLLSERSRAERDLAAEQERNRQHRLLHDTALQSLEAIAGGIRVDDGVRARCRGDAARLRRALRGEPAEPARQLMESLSDLVEEFAQVGLTVEMTADVVEREPPYEARSALVEATREALRNVERHAGVPSAVLHVRDQDGGVGIVVRDHGAGFEPDTTSGFGLTNSVRRRMSELGGTAEIWSQVGGGTRVTLWAPCSVTSATPI